jgi:uncharacterized protein YheU (UPF0270 family)
MEIPYEKLSDGGLQGLIEEFVARKGTEYGVAYVVLETKVRQVLQQRTLRLMKKKKAVIFR